MFSVQQQSHTERIVDAKLRENPMRGLGVKQCLVGDSGSWDTRLGTDGEPSLVSGHVLMIHILPSLCSGAGALSPSASNSLG